MKSLRSLSSQEEAVITALLQSKPETQRLLGSLEGLRVVEMDDGGMGSLSLMPSGVEAPRPSAGREIVSAEFTDRDGVPVSVALNADSDGRLCELEMWKVDFSPLLAWPAAADIKIVG